MKVLFLASCSQRKHLYSNASVRYRCYNSAEDLNSLGVWADVCHVDDFLTQWVEQYDVFIFHRPTDERSCKRAIFLLKEKNKTILADYDDLLFGKENAYSSPAYVNGLASRRLILSANKSYTEALKLFDHFTVSTEPLIGHIKKIKPNAQCQVVHNGVNKRWFDLSGGITLTNNNVIGYFAGGACHNKDFLSISKALSFCFRQHSDSRLLIPEVLTVSEELISSKRVMSFGRQHFLRLPEIMANCSLNIAPLLDNEFNRCKSAIKFLESASVGVPLIATPIPDFFRFNSDGLLFAKSSTEWMQRLDQTMKYPVRIQKQLRDYVYSEGMSAQQSLKLVEFVQGVL